MRTQDAKATKTALIALFPGVKFSVRSRDYGRILVQWTNGPAEQDVMHALDIPAHWCSRSVTSDVLAAERQAREAARVAAEQAEQSREQASAARKAAFRHNLRFGGFSYTLRRRAVQMVLPVALPICLRAASGTI